MSACGGWMSKKVEAYGNCYAVSEALYHILGGKKSGWEPMWLGINARLGVPHWYLKHKDTGLILDASKLQFKKRRKIPYHLGKRKAFLTKKPSERAKNMIIAMTWVQSFKSLVEGIPK